MPLDRFDCDALGAVRSQSDAACHEIACGLIAGPQHYIDEAGKKN